MPPQRAVRPVRARASGGICASLLAGALASCGTAGHAVPASRAALAALSSPAAQLSATQITFGSSTTGWLAVTAGLQAKPWSAVELLRTEDGGQTWQQQWAGDGGVVQLEALGTRHAWLSIAPTVRCPQGTAYARCARLTAAGELLATDDGGRQWRRAWSGPEQLHEVVFVSPRVGLASLQGSPCSIPDKLGIPPSRCPGLVVRTTDGGSQWEQVLRTDGPVLAVASQDGNWLVAQNTWWSGDSGRHWQMLTGLLPGRFCGPDGLPVWAAAPDQATYMAANAAENICPPPAAALEQLIGGGWRQVHLWELGLASAMQWPTIRTGYLMFSGALTRTTDSGRTWRQVWPPLAPTGPLGLLGGGRAVGAEDASSSGAVLQSLDYGKAWSQLADLPGTITAIDFVSPLEGFLVLEQVSQRRWLIEGSQDGGRHWSVLWTMQSWVPSTSPLPGTGISGLWMASPSDGLLLTTGGALPPPWGGGAPAELWATADGGHQWHRLAKVPTGTGWLFAAAAFARDERGAWHGVVESGLGSTVMTSDCGHSWQPVPLFPRLEGAQYLSSTVVVGWQEGAGQRPWLLVSSDGGRQWARRALPASGAQAVSSQGELQFALNGSGLWETGGRSWATSDWGRHWEARAGPVLSREAWSPSSPSPSGRQAHGRRSTVLGSPFSGKVRVERCSISTVIAEASSAGEDVYPHRIRAPIIREPIRPRTAHNAAPGGSLEEYRTRRSRSCSDPGKLARGLGAGLA